MAIHIFICKYSNMCMVLVLWLRPNFSIHQLCHPPIYTTFKSPFNQVQYIFCNIYIYKVGIFLGHYFFSLSNYILIQYLIHFVLSRMMMATTSFQLVVLLVCYLTIITIECAEETQNPNIYNVSKTLVHSAVSKGAG